MAIFDLVDIKEAADLLRISPHTLRLWAFQRRIPVVKLGRRCLFRKIDLEDFVERNLRPAADIPRKSRAATE